MADLRTLVWLVSLLVLAKVAAERCEETSAASAPIQVFISGRRNQTGHMISQVAIQRRNAWSDDNRTPDEWALTVQHTSMLCQGGDTMTNILLTFTAPPPPRQCLAGYQLLPDLGCYRLSNITESWAAAQEICSKEGAQLLIISSEAEAEAMKNLMYPIESGQFWVGIYEKGSDGNYVTFKGDPANANTTGYMTWFPGEPNDRTVGNCVLFSINARVGYGYNDYICAAKFQYVCKQ